MTDARDKLRVGDVSGAEKELERAQREAAAMEALAQKLKDARRESEVKVAGTKVRTALAKLKALREHKTTAKEAEHAVKQAVDAAQKLETDEELRKRKEQEKADAEKEVQALIQSAINQLNKSEGTEAKLKLMNAQKIAYAHTLGINFGKEIGLLKEGERYKRSSPPEWHRAMEEVKTLLQGR